MLSPEKLEEYRRVQSLAKKALECVEETIVPEDTEFSIARKATNLLLSQGIYETWYYDVPALVLLGSRSRISVSGRSYTPAQEIVGFNNLVTVDLSPKCGTYWGDCARSFVVENGVVVQSPGDPEMVEGTGVVKQLHRDVMEFVGPDTTFHELYEYGNNLISHSGYENLDFRQNLGHSIVENLSQRVFIEEGNSAYLHEVPAFTFEPHIGIPGGRWGFKHENIYFFDEDGNLREL